MVLAEETLKGLQIEKPLLMEGGEHGLCMEKVTTAGRWGSLPGRWGMRRISVIGEKRKSIGESGGIQGTALGSRKDA